MNDILVIEDNDLKWERMAALLTAHYGADRRVTRATDLFEGNRQIDKGGWTLLVLDISLDVRTGSGRGRVGAQDYTGGLKIVGRMYYLGKEVPTIIITGFDSFPSGLATQDSDVVLGLEDVEREARRKLGSFLIGTIRYGPNGWEAEFSALLARHTKDAE